jgi:hypothetical protein
MQGYELLPETTNDYQFDRGLEWWEEKEIKRKKKKKLKKIAKRNKQALINFVLFSAGFALITMAYAIAKISHII